MVIIVTEVNRLFK